MDLTRLHQIDDYRWSVPLAPGEQRGPVLLYGSAPLLATMDDKVLEQLTNVARLPGLVPGGLHAYDGHNNQDSLADREDAVRRLMEPVLALRSHLEKRGLPVPRLIAGGTPTFPVFARMDLPGLECSPGTFVLHDHGYGSRYRDMAGFVPAAVLLTL